MLSFWLIVLGLFPDIGLLRLFTEATAEYFDFSNPALLNGFYLTISWIFEIRSLLNEFSSACYLKVGIVICAFELDIALSLPDGPIPISFY